MDGSSTRNSPACKSQRKEAVRPVSAGAAAGGQGTASLRSQTTFRTIASAVFHPTTFPWRLILDKATVVKAPEKFVSDEFPLHRLAVLQTSGTTGNATQRCDSRTSASKRRWYFPLAAQGLGWCAVPGAVVAIVGPSARCQPPKWSCRSGAWTRWSGDCCAHPTISPRRTFRTTPMRWLVSAPISFTATHLHCSCWLSTYRSGESARSGHGLFILVAKWLSGFPKGVPVERAFWRQGVRLVRQYRDDQQHCRTGATAACITVWIMG